LTAPRRRTASSAASRTRRASLVSAPAPATFPSPALLPFRYGLSRIGPVPAGTGAGSPGARSRLSQRPCPEEGNAPRKCRICDRPPRVRPQTAPSAGAAGAAHGRPPQPSATPPAAATATPSRGGAGPTALGRSGRPAACPTASEAAWIGGGSGEVVPAELGDGGQHAGRHQGLHQPVALAEREPRADRGADQVGGAEQGDLRRRSGTGRAAAVRRGRPPPSAPTAGPRPLTDAGPRVGRSRPGSAGTGSARSWPVRRPRAPGPVLRTSDRGGPA